MEEKNQMKKMQDEIRKLKQALADSQMAQKCLEAVIEEANKEYKTDLKKSFGSDAYDSTEKSSPWADFFCSNLIRVNWRLAYRR